MCQSSVNLCMGGPCVNGGVCFPGQSGSCDFKCICPAMYTGKKCESLVDPCSGGSVCKNGGSCVATSTQSYICVCVNGFTGLNCDIQVTILF